MCLRAESGVMGLLRRRCCQLCLFDELLHPLSLWEPVASGVQFRRGGLCAGDCKAGLGVCDREAVEARYGCADPQAADILQRAAGGWAKDGEEHSQEWLCHKGKSRRAPASGWSAMFPASVAVFKCGHDPSTPQDHPGHKERAPLGMTAKEKER